MLVVEVQISAKVWKGNVSMSQQNLKFAYNFIHKFCVRNSPIYLKPTYCFFFASYILFYVTCISIKKNSPYQFIGSFLMDMTSYITFLYFKVKNIRTGKEFRNYLFQFLRPKEVKLHSEQVSNIRVVKKLCTSC